ncbi:unnamed protein product [Miscanthus lutarioriparius]|uniref:Uncharacterized protein n=1 Tax=Miscanthus lutarioriparius TaxID=422564 RepID=A0A811P4Q8_9POAL|nr:unnamed protein product [Miscanthus lutarioriparius]
MAVEARLVAVLAVAAGPGRAAAWREDVLPQQRDPTRPTRRAQPGPPPSPQGCWPTSRPELIRHKIKRTSTVAEALQDKQWIRDIAGRATVNAISQYVHLWHAIAGVQLSGGTEDRVWHTVSAMLNIQNATPAQEISLMDWWLQKREGFNAIKRKGLDSTFMLVSWRIWKEHNDRVFSRTTEKNPAELAQVISEEAHLWCAAGAKFLSTLG